MLRDRDEFDADGTADLEFLTCRRELAVVEIHFEGDDVPRVLISGEEELALGIDSEITRSFPLSGLVFDQGQLAGESVHCEDRDRMVTTVGSIDKLA